MKEGKIKMSYDEEFVALIDKAREALGDEIFELEGIGSQLDINVNAKRFLSSSVAADVSVDSNANVSGVDVVGYQYELPTPLFKLNSLYLLWEKLKKINGRRFADSVVLSQLKGDIYINDFKDVGRPYCFNFSCYDIVLEGLPMIKKIKSVAPKSLYAFKSQVEQFIVIAGNSTLGATGIADVLICMAMYVERMEANDYKDGHIQLASERAMYAYVDETIASLIYTLNQPMRGNQSPFTNVSLYDDEFLKGMLEGYCFPGEKHVSLETVKWVQKIYIRVMNREMRRTPITFPITTACFAKEDDGTIKDQSFVQLVANQNMEWGYINMYTGKSSTLSSCCRLRSSTDNEYFNSFGAGSSKIGSLGVVTLNLPLYAEVADSWDEFVDMCNMHVGIACHINNAKRSILNDRINNGNMPLYTHGHMDLSKQYSTVGITGLYEAFSVQGLDVANDTHKVIELLDEMNAHIDTYAKRFNAPHNMEQVPGESSCVKLAKKDYLMGYNRDSLGTQRVPFYSNQFLPLHSNVDMLTRIKVQGQLDAHFSGGSIMQVQLLKKPSDVQVVVDLINHTAKMGVIYWAMNYTLGECENGHMVVGSTCNICNGTIVSTYTRVVGFLTKVDAWNKVRREEDKPRRKEYKI